ncbi:MAG: hypothetical protein QOG23_536 [Blastocatellia bacterium]|jgi:outer membrane lipoprotein-sorting protein|nr:hypothetical protein [Blastocatellia bacterium]
MRNCILLFCLILIVPTTAAAKIKTTEDLVSDMQKKYAKSWYRTATFVQKTTDYDKDGNKKVSTCLKFDLSILREDTWQGRPAYVVGAKQGDLHSAQFWIDQKNLYFVRMLRPAGKDGAQTQETQFNKYQRLGGGWMAPEVIFKVDGQVRTTEEYSEMRANPALDARLFDPQYWTRVHWRE